MCKYKFGEYIQAKGIHYPTNNMIERTPRSVSQSEKNSGCPEKFLHHLKFAKGTSDSPLSKQTAQKRPFVSKKNLVRAPTEARYFWGRQRSQKKQTAKTKSSLCVQKYSWELLLREHVPLEAKEVKN